MLIQLGQLLLVLERIHVENQAAQVWVDFVLFAVYFHLKNVFFEVAKRHRSAVCMRCFQRE